MVETEPAYILGLDLHGTLLEPGEVIRPELVNMVSEGLARIKDRISRFICTGNDLKFVKEKVPPEILEQVDGYVLETGCSLSPDGETEKILTTKEELKTIWELEGQLRAQSFPEINYFAHRLTTISMFSDDPRSLHEKIEGFVGDSNFHDRVQVTYSSVAVDILPVGYNKYTGLAAVAGDREIIGVADSMNDQDLLADSHFSLAPANIATELRPLLEKAGRNAVPLMEAPDLISGTVLIANKAETEGVLEILDFLDRMLA
ncbi:MAG: hypothetical protein R6V10_01340 [bacterium]